MAERGIRQERTPEEEAERIIAARARKREIDRLVKEKEDEEKTRAAEIAAAAAAAEAAVTEREEAERQEFLRQHIESLPEAEEREKTVLESMDETYDRGVEQVKKGVKALDRGYDNTYLDYVNFGDRARMFAASGFGIPKLIEGAEMGAEKVLDGAEGILKSIEDWAKKKWSGAVPWFIKWPVGVALTPVTWAQKKLKLDKTHKELREEKKKKQNGEKKKKGDKKKKK